MSSTRHASEEAALAKTRSIPTYETFLAPEVSKRLQGHDQLVQNIEAIARREAQSRGLVLRQIAIRPAWSHESDEQTGVVIDVEVKATLDERFSYWDTLCEQIQHLETLLAPEEQRFLNDDITLIVSRS